MTQWQLQEAKARLSEVVRQAREAGPQAITVRGQAQAVVLSAEDYARLTQPKSSFLQFMRSSPLVGVALSLVRDASPARRVRL